MRQLVMIGLVGATLVQGTTVLWATTLRVANNGVDSQVCGGKGDPCWSISRAVANAAAGDRIIVGPGRYGDLDRDGLFGEPGEEAAEVGFGCECMIKLDKELELLSSDGAGVTVLDASGAAISVVRISAAGVVLGAAKKGFTLTGGATNACFFGGGLVESTGGVRVEGNWAINNGCFGFFVTNGVGHVLRKNLASANAVHGFFLSGATAVTLDGNQSIANGGVGRADGYVVFGSGHVLVGNTAIGNQGFGISVTGGTDHTISKNNIYGNNAENITGAQNCGLFNAVSGGVLEAKENFWGAASGPGPDPADAVCDAGGSSTTTVPFATKPLAIKGPK